MQIRESALNDWLNTYFGEIPFTLAPLAGDASFRRYYRLHTGDKTFIVMDAPPTHESLTAFIHVTHLLEYQGIHVPTIHAINEAQGFLLLEDLGDALFLKELSQANVDNLYAKAMATLITIQRAQDDSLPVFNEAFMLSELNLFPTWFLSRYLNLTLNSETNQCINDAFHWLATAIARQPQVFIHRDYHSRNLILINDDVGVIDYQDAMRGPFTYDVVSLLKDCYIQWPRESISRWCAEFHAQLPHSTRGSFNAFQEAVELCGLQRHLKVLGVFCRLHLRDHKSTYLADLSLTFHYVMATLEEIPELSPFYHFMLNTVQPLFLKRSK